MMKRRMEEPYQTKLTIRLAFDRNKPRKLEFGLRMTQGYPLD